jgi:hypothetical protein
MESDLENADPAANARRLTVPSVLAPAKRDALMQKLRDQKKKAWLAEVFPPALLLARSGAIIAVSTPICLLVPTTAPLFIKH